MFTRQTWTILAASAVAVLACAVDASARGTTTTGRGRGNGGGTTTTSSRPTYGASRLKPPSGASDRNAVGVIEAKNIPQTRRTAARSWLRIATKKLNKGAYTVWMDDPSTTTDSSVADTGAAFRTNRAGEGRVGWDTARGGSLPFGATIASLVGMTVEIHDANGNVALTGTVPRLR